MLSEMILSTLIRYGLAKCVIFNQYSKSQHISTNDVWQNIPFHTIHRITTIQVFVLLHNDVTAVKTSF